MIEALVSVLLYVLGRFGQVPTVRLMWLRPTAAVIPTSWLETNNRLTPPYAWRIAVENFGSRVTGQARVKLGGAQPDYPIEAVGIVPERWRHEHGEIVVDLIDPQQLAEFTLFFTSKPQWEAPQLICNEQLVGRKSDFLWGMHHGPNWFVITSALLVPVMLGLTGYALHLTYQQRWSQAQEAERLVDDYHAALGYRTCAVHRRTIGDRAQADAGAREHFHGERDFLALNGVASLDELQRRGWAMVVQCPSEPQLR